MGDLIVRGDRGSSDNQNNVCVDEHRQNVQLIHHDYSILGNNTQQQHEIHHTPHCSNKQSSVKEGERRPVNCRLCELVQTQEIQSQENSTHRENETPVLTLTSCGFCFQHRRERAAWRAFGLCLAFGITFVALVAVNLMTNRHPTHSLNGLRASQDSNEDASFSFDINATCTHLRSKNDTCYFVTHAEDCQPDSGFINYLQFTYCTLHSVPAAVSILIIWLVMLFIALGATAEDLYAVELLQILINIFLLLYGFVCYFVSFHILKLSHNVAGVTFLAFGNGAPDIFSVYSSINNVRNGMQLAIGELFGAGIFVTTVVVGTISFYYPFTLTRRPFLRDVITYIVGVSWTYAVLWRHKITMGESIGFVSLYVVYVLVVIIGHRVYQSMKDTQQKVTEITSVTGVPVNETQTSDHQLHRAHTIAEAFDVVESIGIVPALGHDITTGHAPASMRLRNFSEDDSSRIENEPLMDSSHFQPRVIAWKQFLRALIPFSSDDFSSSSVFGKIYLVLSAPITFALTITTPVVDLNEDDNRWVQYLTMLQCVVSPIFIVFGIGFGDVTFSHTYPLWLFLFAVGCVAALCIWAFTFANYPPGFYKYFSFLGFAVSVVWIYIVANEIVNLLQALGRIFDISDAILGLTVLAWGNSIGDFVSNMTVARQGYPRMAVGASFGGPALNVLLGIGISCIIACVRHDGVVPVHDQPSHQLAVSGGFLLLSLLSSLIIIPLNKFSANRKFGFYLWFLYAAYLSTALTLEFM